MPKKMKTSFSGLVQLLAKSLYPEPDVFIRELIQNAHDSIRFRQVKEPGIQGQIEVFTDLSSRTITYIDNGKGMDEQDIEDFLSTIGRSGTGESKQDYKEQNISVETIGQFGIGLLSAFVVAEQIDVYTRKTGDSQTWHWSNKGGEAYDLLPFTNKLPVGTKVVVKIHKDHLSHIKEDNIRKTIKKYADFIPFNIMLNGNGPVNVVNAPWHKKSWAGEKDYENALYRFLNDRYPDTPIHIIPVQTESPRAYGALYISGHTVSQINTSGVVDIFQERMAIRMKDQELLPDWAKFITGVIDSPDLHPTAARDNIIKNDAYFRLRKVLGELIIQSLIDLSQKSREKFFRICEWHHYHLKGMAVNHQEFYDSVIELLPFETNQGQMTLKDYQGRQSYEAGKRIPVYFFSYGYDSNQFYELCDAKGLITINTGKAYDETLVRQYVENNQSTLVLKQMDHLDDKGIFQSLDPDEHQQYFRLENAIRRALERVGVNRVRPIARRFSPKTMSAAIISTQEIEAYDKMQKLLDQPFMIEGLGEMAEEVSEKLKQKPLELLINVDNDLIQQLQQLDNLDDQRYLSIHLGVFYSAILYSQHRMTPENAKIFYHHMQQQTLSSLKLEQELNQVRRDKAELQRSEIERQQAMAEAKPDHDWVRLFVMMSYETKYDDLETALKEILEAPPYYFELQMARSQHKDRTLKGNIQAHVLSADGYIADISDHSSNVMLELGWVYFDPKLGNRLIIILRAEDGKPLSVDLSGFVTTDYPSLSDNNLTKVLRKKFEVNRDLQELMEQVNNKTRKRFLSPRLFRGNKMISNEAVQCFCKVFNTVEEILEMDENSFKDKLEKSGNSDFDVLYVAVKNHLSKL
jgi:molecular chaperone HtpG